MNCIEYYGQLGIDLSLFSRDERNTIASFFLENMIFTKEEIESLFGKGESEKIEGGLADGKTLEDIAKHHKISIKEIEKEFELGKSVEKEHTKDNSVADEIAKDHLWEIPDYYTRLKEMEKEAKEDDFEKGKKAEIGEIREWSGVKMQKTAQGWLPVKKDGSMSKEENGGKMSSVEKQEQKKEYSEKELEEFARKTSESDLKQAASGEDEQLRIVAKKELERRKVEENPAKKDEPVKETKENKDTVLHKKKQLEIILNNNPSLDEIHTWIRKEEDIKTAEEAFNESIESDESTPDFKKEDMENALKEGSVIIYSSYPIKDGVFVTPSKMEAQSYAGKKDVFSKKVNLDDIAWIDGLQGQFAPINKIEEIKKDNKQDTKIPSSEQLIEKFRTLSDEQVKFYLNAPYEEVKNAAKFIADERGLKIEESFEPLDLKSFSKRDEFFKSFDNNLDKLSEQELGVIIDYRNDSGNLNRFLRQGPDDFSTNTISELNRQMESLDSVFKNSLFKLDSDIISYRGIIITSDFFSQLKPGDVFSDKGFVSTTIDKMVTDNFISSRRGVNNAFLEIRIKKGSNIIPAQIIGDNDGRLKIDVREDEIILNRNSNFRVISNTLQSRDNKVDINKLIVELI